MINKSNPQTFSIAKNPGAAASRPLAGGVSASVIPDVAEMGFLSRGGGVMHDEVVDSDIHVYLHNYMQKGSVYSPAFSKTIIAVLMKTGSRPSPLYQLMKQVQLYGSSTEGLDQNAPKNMLEVESRY